MSFVPASVWTCTPVASPRVQRDYRSRRAVYESGPIDFDRKRSHDTLGPPCCVGTVSKMVRPEGDRVKTGGRNAPFLARMLAIGNIAETFRLAPEQEAVRDLAQACADVRKDLMAARNRLSKMLLRKGLFYPGKTAWTIVPFTQKRPPFSSDGQEESPHPNDRHRLWACHK